RREPKRMRRAQAAAPQATARQGAAPKSADKKPAVAAEQPEPSDKLSAESSSDSPRRWSLPTTVPAWMVSLSAHLVSVLALALLTVRPPEKPLATILEGSIA